MIECVGFNRKSDAEKWRRHVGQGEVIPMSEVPDGLCRRSKLRGHKWAFKYECDAEPVSIKGLNA